MENDQATRHARHLLQDNESQPQTSDLVVASPVEDYFLYIDEMRHPDKEEAEKITQPILDALGEEFYLLSSYPISSNKVRLMLIFGLWVVGVPVKENNGLCKLKVKQPLMIKLGKLKLFKVLFSQSYLKVQVLNIEVCLLVQKKRRDFFPFMVKAHNGAQVLGVYHYV